MQRSGLGEESKDSASGLIMRLAKSAWYRKTSSRPVRFFLHGEPVTTLRFAPLTLGRVLEVPDSRGSNRAVFQRIALMVGAVWSNLDQLLPDNRVGFP